MSQYGCGGKPYPRSMAKIRTARQARAAKPSANRGPAAAQGPAQSAPAGRRASRSSRDSRAGRWCGWSAPSAARAATIRQSDDSLQTWPTANGSTVTGSPRSCQQFAQHIVVGQAVGERLEAADGDERLPAQRDGRAEARLRQVRAARRPRRPGENGCRWSAAPAATTGCRSKSRSRDRSPRRRGARARATSARQIIASHADIAVGQHDDVMRDARAHVDEVCDLRIGAHRRACRPRARSACRDTRPAAARPRRSPDRSGSRRRTRSEPRRGNPVRRTRPDFRTGPTSSPCSGLRMVTAGAEASARRLRPRGRRARSAAARIMNRQPNAAGGPQHDQQQCRGS